MAGRPPKPTHLKVLEGNPGKRALNKSEPKPKIKAPSCPRHLIGEARKEWNRITKALLKLKLLTEVDRAALAAYCQAWARWVYAEEKITELVDLERQAKVKAAQLAADAKARIDELTAQSTYLKQMGMGPKGGPKDGQIAELAAEVARIEATLAVVDSIGGLVKVTDKGYAHATPWIQISNLAQKQMRAFLVEFGMTPASRSRVVVSKEEEADPYAEFLSKRRSGTSGA